MCFKKIIIKIGQFNDDISTFEVPGSKWNVLLPRTTLLFCPLVMLVVK